MKKVTLQDIADSLGVSRISVWKVFSGRSGVSDDLRNKIITKASELEYNFPKDFELPDYIKSAQKQLNISLAISRPQPSVYWMTILHELAKELAKNNMNLIYTYLPSQIPHDYSLPTQLINGSIDGIIVMNVYNNDLQHLLSKLSIPKVFLDTTVGNQFEQLNGDLVITAGRSISVQITEHLISQNKSKIGFIGDVNLCYSNRERYEGFLDAMSKHHLSVDKKYCYTGPIHMNTAEYDITSFLNRLDSYPDAFICLNDYIACILQCQLTNKGIHNLTDVIILDFDGIQQLRYVKDMTTLYINSQNVGIRLANQILYRIQHPNLNHEMVYINSTITYNTTNSSI